VFPSRRLIIATWNRHGFPFRFISQLQSIYSPPIMKQDLYLCTADHFCTCPENRAAVALSFAVSPSSLGNYVEFYLRVWFFARVTSWSLLLPSQQRRWKTHFVVALAPIARPNGLDIRRLNAPIELSAPIVSGNRLRIVTWAQVPRWRLWNKLEKDLRNSRVATLCGSRHRVERKLRLCLVAHVSTLDKWTMLTLIVLGTNG